MRQYANTTEETLITFHTGRGGRFYNGGHKEYVDQDTTIDSYTGDLFTAFENQAEIDYKIGDRDNLRSLFEKAIDGDADAFNRFEKLTGLKFGKEIHVDCNGSPVGLDVENDGTGIIDIDGQYNTTVVCRLEDCSDDELLLIYNSNRYVSEDVREYCKGRLLEANMIFEEEE